MRAMVGGRRFKIDMASAQDAVSSSEKDSAMGLDGGPGGLRGKHPRGQLFTALEATLRRILGAPSGGKPGGGGFDVGGVGRKQIRWLVVILLTIWGVAGIYIIEEPEQGVVLRFGHHVRTTDPGPHWVPVFIERIESAAHPAPG